MKSIKKWLGNIVSRECSTENTNLRIHQWLDKNAQSDWISVDLTCGNGHDTFKLAQLTKEVIAIDIQTTAIVSTLEKTKDFNNVKLYHLDHQKIDEVVDFGVDLVIMNCGYLPNSDKSIKTEASSTLIALSKIEPYVKVGGYFIITCYPGHRGGKEELKTVKQWLGHHPNFEISTFEYPKFHTPITFIAHKISRHSR